MKRLFGFRMFSKALARWVYPSWCVLCGSFLSLTEDHICRPCFAKMSPIRPPLCRLCGVEIPPHAERTSRCPRCRTRPFSFDEVSSIFRYEEDFKKLLHQIKYERKYWLFEIFMKNLRRALEGRWIDRPSCIVPVPLDARRLRERTFNQSLLIAQMISKILNIPVREKVLSRKPHRTRQSWLSRKERLMNLQGLFRVKGRCAIENQWVLLVDDVVTTGATVHECSKMMKEAGAQKVSVFALARTPSLA